MHAYGYLCATLRAQSCLSFFVPSWIKPLLQCPGVGTNALLHFAGAHGSRRVAELCSTANKRRP
eukprot:6490829-Amphidinium_carterae.1